MVSQKKLINQLKIFKKLGVTGVKQSLADEGVSFKDIEIMRIFCYVIFFITNTMGNVRLLPKI